MEAALRAEHGLPPAAEPMTAQAPPGGRLPCPACGHQMFSEWWSSEICDVCFWEEDLFQLRYPWSQIGANGGVSLIEAQANVERIGAVRQDLVRHVRTRADDEPLDPGWRPIDPRRDPVEWQCDGDTPYPEDQTVLPLGTHAFEVALRAGLERPFPVDGRTAVLPTVPHGYADLALVAADLAAAGFAVEEEQELTLQGRAASTADLATGYATGTPVRAVVEERGDGPAVRATVIEEMTARLGPVPVTTPMAAYVFRAAT
ncbi:CPCC family cysteine-rich protein [Streptomyces sp. NPDC023838]|uniref:CPCC family cysteine-rich protein n=1 Tax=Streptomyces sp. NPDC023838 TaxID=3154325 RepID=UPI0033DEF2DE